MIYRCVDGDVLDAICWRYYGRESAIVAVLEANPGLARVGAAYEAGRVIVLPDLPDVPEQKAIRLWD